MWNDDTPSGARKSSRRKVSAIFEALVVCTATGEVLFANAEAIELFEAELQNNEGEPWKSFVTTRGGLWHDQNARIWDVSVEESMGATGTTFMLKIRQGLAGAAKPKENNGTDERLFVGLTEAAESLSTATSDEGVSQVCARVLGRFFALAPAGLITSRHGDWKTLHKGGPKAERDVLLETCERGTALVVERKDGDWIGIPVLLCPSKNVVLVGIGSADEERLKAMHALAAFARTILERNALEEEKRQFSEGIQAAHQELLSAYDETVLGWTKALDLRDKITEGHTQRVTDLTVKLARRLGMNERQIVSIRRGALLHDIGKVGIPDSILMKEGSLNDEEWEIMRSHTTLAHDMLSGIGFLRSSLDIPYCHHERWDGKGYPRGLAGEDIPFCARLFAVVDVWDALTSDRPYRKAMAHEEARQLVADGSGTQFDPTVVSVFLKMVDELRD